MVTLYHPSGITKQFNDDAVDYYIQNFKWSRTPIQSSPPPLSTSLGTNNLLARPGVKTDMFTNTNKVYLYDAQEKTYRPIDSPAALAELMGLPNTQENIAKITENINVLTSADLNMPEWAGTVISSTDSIKADGVNGLDKIPKSSTPAGKIGKIVINKYGRPDNPTAEGEVGNIIGALFTTIKNTGAEGISQETFDKYIKDPETLAKYVSATLYGGYSFGDIYRDVKAKDLALTNPKYANFKGFDENMSATEWYKTEEGKKIAQDINLAIPPSAFNIDPSLFNNTIFKISGDAFKTLVPPVDWNDPKFIKEAEDIQASYYDIMDRKMKANTEQQAAVVESDWNIFKDNLNKKYGIQLSNNARTAWEQLEGLFSGASAKGLTDSGILNEAMDKYLNSVRRGDKLLRENKLNEEEANFRDKLIKTGSSKQIQDFVNSSPENRKKAEDWGLIPDAEERAWWSKENLKAKYPTLSDKEIEEISTMMIDENGNYRSELYQTNFANLYDLGQQKKTYQQNKLYQQKLDEEKKAYSSYTGGNPLSSYQPESPFEEGKLTEAPTEASIETKKIVGDKQPEVPPGEIAPSWNKNTRLVWSASGSQKEVPADQYNTYIAQGWKASAPTPASSNQNQQSGVTPNYLDTIKSVFGNTWKSSFSSDIQTGKGVLGAVRVQGTDKVYSLGNTGATWINSPDAYKNIFGDLNQSGRVGEITPSQAKKLKIPGY